MWTPALGRFGGRMKKSCFFICLNFLSLFLFAHGIILTDHSRIKELSSFTIMGQIDLRTEKTYSSEISPPSRWFRKGSRRLKVHARIFRSSDPFARVRRQALRQGSRICPHERARQVESRSLDDDRERHF